MYRFHLFTLSVTWMLMYTTVCWTTIRFVGIPFASCWSHVFTQHLPVSPCLSGFHRLGFESLVRRATGEVQRYLRDPQSYQLPDIMDAQQLVEVAVQHLPVTSPLGKPSTSANIVTEDLPTGGPWAATGAPMMSMPSAMSVPNWTPNSLLPQYYTIPFHHPGYPAYPTPSAASALPMPSAFSQGSLSQPIYGSPLAGVMSPTMLDTLATSQYYLNF